MGVLVDKASETMAAVQNREQFHGADDGEEEELNGCTPQVRA
jgi:hypothetical protein